MPIVLEGPEVEAPKVEVLCLSSDSDSYCEDQSDSECSLRGRTIVVIASSDHQSDDSYDDELSLVVKESVFNFDMEATCIEEPQGNEASIRARK